MEPGNKVYFDELANYFNYMDEFTEKGKTFQDCITEFQVNFLLSKKKALMVFKAAAPSLAREATNIGFELLGFDFMIDDNLKVYLIEVNENPCLSTLSDRQSLLITSLIQDTLSLTVDPVFNLGHSGESRFSEDCSYKTRFALIHSAVDDK